MIEPGTILQDKYRVERLLGQGGIGAVVLARHLQLDELVAIKVLLPKMRRNQEAHERFLREARAAVKLKSEHACRVFDVGTMAGNMPYMVMEYLVGQDLANLQGARAPGQAVDFVLQACEALAEAHALGIVHRDIKPANLFVTHRVDGSLLLKVLDFGIAKAPGIMVDGALTADGTVIGTPMYMSPE